MENQALVRDFSQLRIPQPAEWPRPSAEFARPSADWPRPASDWSRLNSDRLRPYAMEGLVQDFNTALEETAGSHSGERSTGRRKAWKRRCKSTSNLLQAGQIFSEDSSSSLDNFGILSRDRGTSSLQLSDSDLDGVPHTGRRNRLGRLQDHKKRGLLDPLGIESDSFTENISPFKEFRVNSKRKRKSKRMAVDQSSENLQPLLPPSFVFRSPVQGTKRKKVRSRSGCETGQGRKAGITPGKRKRSAREKSADSLLSTDKYTSKEVEKMETEEEGLRSSSSLSSSEWEDLGSDLSIGDNDGREADDEQSDWPGPEPGMSVMQLTDEEADPDISFNVLPIRMSSLSRGKSLNLREIKAGTRRLRAQRTGPPEGTRKLSHAEIVSRFLQDPLMRCVRVPLSRGGDRNVVLSLASLYSLSWSQESETSILLTKVHVKIPHLPAVGEFAVPGIPKSKDGHGTRKKFEPKRLKKAPALSPVYIEAESTKLEDKLMEALYKGPGTISHKVHGQEHRDQSVETVKNHDVGMSTRYKGNKSN